MDRGRASQALDGQKQASTLGLPEGSLTGQVGKGREMGQEDRNAELCVTF